MTVKKQEYIHISIYHNNECINFESIREEFENDIKEMKENEVDIIENLRD